MSWDGSGTATSITSYRSGMTDLIQTLRQLGDAGTADFTAGTVTYWTDAQLQSILDRHRSDYYFYPMTSTTRYNTGGTTEYKDYQVGHSWLEGGTLLTIQQSDGAAIGTASYTVDYESGKVEFTSDTGGSALYVNCRSYDMNLSAADLWKRKAANAALMYDFSTDNHDMKRSQYMQHCNQMAGYYESQAGPQTGDLYRSDCNG